MSNGRKLAGVAAGYRQGYLQSPAWKARRARWLEQERERTGGIVRCWATGAPLKDADIELHHLDYRGVKTLPDGRWWADEPHEDLVPLHKVVHRALHQIIDDDQALRTLMDRRRASAFAAERLRSRMRALETKPAAAAQLAGTE